MKFGYFDQNGRITQAESDSTVADIPAGALALTDEQFADRFSLLLVDGVLEVSPPPANMGDLVSDKNAEINRARARANVGTFDHDGKAFACDPLSRSDIDGVNGYVAIYGALPPAWPGAWKAADNSYYLIADVDAWKAFYASMVAAGTTNFAHAQALKAQLAAATTAEDIAAIQW